MLFDIRQENKADHQAIYRVTEEAFRDMPFADGDEQDVIDRLRSAGALSLSLVATVNDDLVGQVTFSPATSSCDSGPWYALGPVSVLPEHQGKGIGSALISQGLEHIRRRGAVGCILTGNPAYYSRFGFEPAPANAPENEPAEYFMVKLFEPAELEGRFQFHTAFYGSSA